MCSPANRVGVFWKDALRSNCFCKCSGVRGAIWGLWAQYTIAACPTAGRRQLRFCLAVPPPARLDNSLDGAATEGRRVPEWLGMKPVTFSSALAVLRISIEKGRRLSRKRCACSLLPPEAWSDRSCSTHHNARLPWDGDRVAGTAFGDEPRGWCRGCLDCHSRALSGIIAGDRANKRQKYTGLLQLFPHRVDISWAGSTHLAGCGKRPSTASKWQPAVGLHRLNSPRRCCAATARKSHSRARG